MNREQKRAFVKKAKKNGTREEIAKAYAKIIGDGAGTPTAPQTILEDEKVKLDIDKIKARKNYEIMSAQYKEFVESNIETIFTAHVKYSTVISLKEEPKWLFWSGDLIKVKDGE